MFAKSSFVKFTQLINNLVSFAGSLVAVFSFCIAVYGFFYPAKIAEKVIDFETAFNEARNDLKNISNNISAISTNTADTATNTQATAANTASIADGVKTKLDWILNTPGTSDFASLSLRNETTRAVKGQVFVEVTQYQKNTPEREHRTFKDQVSFIIPASESFRVSLSEVFFMTFPNDNWVWKEDGKFCVYFELIDANLPPMVEKRVYAGDKVLIDYEYFEGSAQDCD